MWNSDSHTEAVTLDIELLAPCEVICIQQTLCVSKWISLSNQPSQKRSGRSWFFILCFSFQKNTQTFITLTMFFPNFVAEFQICVLLFASWWCCWIMKTMTLLLCLYSLEDIQFTYKNKGIFHALFTCVKIYSYDHCRELITPVCFFFHSDSWRLPLSHFVSLCYLDLDWLTTTGATFKHSHKHSQLSNQARWQKGLCLRPNWLRNLGHQEQG